MFCVQKHAASTLHYDFRLEIDGVLKSWSVPKGPSLDPKDKRLAVQTEDHPVDYGDFEGVIPAGEYGGGTVMLWDRGTFEATSDPHAGLEKGKLDFVLHGDKLEGGFSLVRMKGKGRSDGKNWLLVKRSDDQADSELDLVAREARSAKTGRDMQSIAQDEDATGEQTITAAKTDPAPPGTSAKRGGAMFVEGVRLTNPDKILYDEQELTKADLAAYYLTVREFILPHIEKRPLTLVRCPEGSSKKCFYQKHPKAAVPEAMGTIEIEEASGKGTYMVAESFASVLAAVQVGALELHIWGSRVDRLERPDRLVFDLDPAPEVGFEVVCASALAFRDALEHAGLASGCMTTGGKGLHVVVPLERYHDFDEVKAYARAWARKLTADAPEHFVDQASKAKRRGKIFVDYLRNGRGATAVCPYSTRAKAGAPVATPVSWEEVRSGVRPADFRVATIGRRLETLGSDPWEELQDVRQRLSKDAWKGLPRESSR